MGHKIFSINIGRWDISMEFWSDFQPLILKCWIPAPPFWFSCALGGFLDLGPVGLFWRRVRDEAQLLPLEEVNV